MPLSLGGDHEFRLGFSPTWPGFPDCHGQAGMGYPTGVDLPAQIGNWGSTLGFGSSRPGDPRPDRIDQPGARRNRLPLAPSRLTGPLGRWPFQRGLAGSPRSPSGAPSGLDAPPDPNPSPPLRPTSTRARPGFGGPPSPPRAEAGTLDSPTGHPAASGRFPALGTEGLGTPPGSASRFSG